MKYDIHGDRVLVTKSIKYGDWNHKFKASKYAPAIERFLLQL